MCGIAGLIYKNKNVNKNIFFNMLCSLEKRGPDAEGFYINKNIALGHRRLSVIDLSKNANQPLFNENNTILVIYNGEIYNYYELKQKLLKHDFKTKTDTEILIHLYENNGYKLVDEIEGMFVFCIYDINKQIMTFARDHIGKKPLFYYFDDEIFAFASELKTLLLCDDIKKRINIDINSLTKFLFYGYIPSPNSIFKEIKKLEPATAFQFDINKWEIKNYYNYWKINFEIKEKYNEKECLEKIEYLIEEAIRKRLVSDVPIGIFLSGGVDSSLVASIMSKNYKNINAFSICYKNSPEADEAKYATRVANRLGLNYELCNFEDDLIKENFLGMINYLDEPLADAAIFPLYYLSKYARNKIIVALSGDGGDEIFGGYEKYKAQYYIEKYFYLFQFISVYKNFLKKDSSFYKLLSSYNLPYYVRQFIFGSGSFLYGEAAKLLNLSRIDLDSIFEESKKYYNEFDSHDILNKSMYLDCKIQLPDWYLVKADRATMANSIELRSPLLDKNLIEFMFTIEGKYKMQNMTTKYLEKKLLKKYIDNDIIYRKKSGFGVPLDKWIRNELKELFNDYILQKNNFFNYNYIIKIYNEHLKKTFDHRFKLLRIFIFNYWLKNTNLESINAK